MKIKTKKTMTEKEYLHYVIDKTDFLSISHDFIHVNHDTVHSDIVLELHDQNNTTCANTWVDSEGETVFEVEIEEEITEETKLDYLLDHFINPYGQHYVGNIYHNRSINDVLEENDEMEIATNSIHFFDKETKEFKLIWSNGKLVE